MTRIKIVGSCLIAAFALGAILASSASADEYGECVKAPKVGMTYTGAYLDKACMQPASTQQTMEGHLNKYGWQKVQPANTAFTGETSSATFKWIGGYVTCKGRNAITGEILGWQKSAETINFEKCYLAGSGYYQRSRDNCWSEAFPITSSEITSNVLAGYLVGHGTTSPGGGAPKEGESWGELESDEHQPSRPLVERGQPPYLAEWECLEELEYRVSGTVGGVVTSAGKPAKTAKVSFGEGQGEQNLTIEYSLNHGASWYGAEPVTLTTGASVKFGSKLEVRPCNAAGAASEGKGGLTCEHEETGFSIAKLQEIAGSGEGFTSSELTVEIGQTVDYEITVKNTDKTSLMFGALKDSACEGITPSGATELASGESETFTCTRKLTSTGNYYNVASIEGNEGVGTKNSNTVTVEVPAESSFSIAKLQEIAGSGTGFKSSLLTGDVGQTVDYEITVKNTGKTSLMFGALKDSACEDSTPSGATELASGESETFTCTHKLTSTGYYYNTASIEANEGLGTKDSNMVTLYAYPM